MVASNTVAPVDGMMIDHPYPHPYTYGMIWHGMAWHGMAWHGMEWYATTIVVFQNVLRPPSVKGTPIRNPCFQPSAFSSLPHSRACLGYGEESRNGVNETRLMYISAEDQRHTLEKGGCNVTFYRRPGHL